MSDEYLLTIEKKTKSPFLAEERLRDYFAEGPVDANGRERYRFRKCTVRLGVDGGRPIYTPRDRSFWYSDRELHVDCKIDPPNSSVYWSGPTVVQDSECDALVPDYDRMAEYQLIEIWLRHDVFAEFMGLPAESRAIPAEPAAPVDPPAASAPASSTIKVELPDKIKVQLVDRSTPQTKTETPPRKLTATQWITLEAQRLKRLDEIPVGISKTDFAKMLETNMKEAAKADHWISISPVEWRHILNHLQEWGLWPISAIE